MPGIYIFHRRWGVGSDDFVFPMFAEIPLRVAWLITLAAVLSSHSDSFTCNNGHLLKLYYIGMLVILSLTILLDVAIMYSSMKGSILDPEMQRKHVPLMVAIKLVLFLPEIAWNALGTTWAFDDTSNCPSNVVYLIKGATVAGWALVVILIICIYIVFDPLGRPSTEHSEEVRATKLWKWRCKLLCCCIACDRDGTAGAFDDVSKLLADYFLDSNFVATDIAAGLVLVKNQQEQRNSSRPHPSLSNVTTSSVESEGTLPIPGSLSQFGSADVNAELTQPPPWMNLKLAENFMKYALASYGWMYFVYDNRVSGPGKLWFECKCCSCIRYRESEILGDNCCQCNTSAILQQTKIRPEDLMYANFENRLYEIPFYIAFDHAQKSVVIAIRGTLSFYDALTDLTIESEEIQVGDVQEAKAHRGILQAAKYIQMMIDRNGLLVRAFAKTPGYRLVITGHSLGAGAAAILSALLRPSYPDLICFSFSPPGWLVSKSLTRYMEEFVCSVIVGKDIVPRMGVLTMNKLKTQIAIAVRNCKRPKYRILFEGLTKVVCDCSVEGDYEILDNSASESQQADHLLSGPSSRIRNYSEEREPREAQVPRQRQSLVSNPFPLYLPGCVLYLDEISPAKGCCGVPLYQPYWSKPEYFSEVLVNTKMLTDHLPNNVYRALSSAAGEHDDIVTFTFNSQIV